jgi:phosphatidylglycerol:prolipoprotein diacylglycerol transferase
MRTTFIQFGHLHLPVFGLVVALGVMCALALTQWSARRVAMDTGRTDPDQMNPETVWNTALLASAATFVISRLLLVVFNFKSFLQYPLLLLAVPSLTSTGLLLTAVLVYVYIRWRGIPLLPLLDSCAASGALLWAFVNAGYLMDGTRDGMPMGAGTGATAAKPVEVYTLIAAAAILLALVNALRAGYRRGEATGLGLTASGLAIFFIDFYRLPSDLLPNIAVDPSQIIAVVMAAVGGVLLYGVATRLYAEMKDRESDAI